MFAKLRSSLLVVAVFQICEVSGAKADFLYVFNGTSTTLGQPSGSITGQILLSNLGFIAGYAFVHEEGSIPPPYIVPSFGIWSATLGTQDAWNIDHPTINSVGIDFNHPVIDLATSLDRSYLTGSFNWGNNLSEVGFVSSAGADGLWTGYRISIFCTTPDKCTFEGRWELVGFVPEPTTIGVLGIGLLGVGAVKRRRQRS